ncbi:hypothetical protein AB0N81_10570 [Streptomyces sp. NPDC093510]|uniref:hypothetical protein n=1 Tax=Streptomyces sp. NPDC093510 TaxID=3155199 RepID=UPI00342925BF
MGVFIQSDTAVCQDVPADCAPEVFIATHNAQVPPAGELGAFGNLLPVPEAQVPEVAGLQLLSSLLNDSAAQFPSVRLIALRGGYVQAPRKHGEFLWNDFGELEEIANVLSIDKKLIGLALGESAVYEKDRTSKTGVPWITRTEPTVPVEPSDRQARGDFDPATPMPPIFERTADEADMRLVHEELAGPAPLTACAVHLPDELKRSSTRSAHPRRGRPASHKAGPSPPTSTTHPVRRIPYGS